MEITKSCHARVGFLGNPSDGYHGKTISFSLANFSATVTLRSAEQVSVQPHPVHDQCQFPSMKPLADHCSPSAAYGGARLLLSLCRCFYSYCTDHGVAIPQDKNFCLSYETDIPRQAGLSGSSAIITAGLRCLIAFYDLEDRIPLAHRPSLVLRAETDLGIVAGLQDRVIQVYGGLVYMDFDKEHLHEHGHGIYESLPASLLPKLFVIFADNPSDSGKVHSTVKQRWMDGDSVVREAMEEVAALAERGREALLRKDLETLALLINRNFDLRRKMFGDECLGKVNLSMIEVARSVGAAAKFTGSGGAIVAFCPDGEEQEERLRTACLREGFHIVEARLGESST